MRRIAVLAILSLSIAAMAQTPLTPHSFVVQMKANGPRIAGWAKVYKKEDSGEFRQVAFIASIADVDVVPAQSLLRPYMGKALVRYSSQHGQLFLSAAEAAAAPRPPESPQDLFGECEVMFVPREEQWRFEEARCRNSYSKQWILMERAGLLGKPLGDMLAELDTAVPVAPPPPASKRK